MNERVKLRQTIQDLEQEVFKARAALRNAKSSLESYVRQAQALYEGATYKPEWNKMTEELMWPEDCRCGFRGECLAYCNPYK